jgi:hypothetical protein
MAERMIFPKTIRDFIKEYAIKDEEETYTNGSMMIPVFRMEQAHAYYGQEIRNKAIDEFTEKIKHFMRSNVEDAEYFGDCCCEIFESEIDEIAEQMKGV